LKYPNYKNDEDLNVHVRVFHVDVKANGETFEELYIMNAFNYILKVTTLD